jgi:hypothetical protein
VIWEIEYYRSRGPREDLVAGANKLDDIWDWGLCLSVLLALANIFQSFSDYVGARPCTVVVNSYSTI